MFSPWNYILFSLSFLHEESKKKLLTIIKKSLYLHTKQFVFYDDNYVQNHSFYLIVIV